MRLVETDLLRNSAGGAAESRWKKAGDSAMEWKLVAKRVDNINLDVSTKIARLVYASRNEKIWEASDKS